MLRVASPALALLAPLALLLASASPAAGQDAYDLAGEAAMLARVNALREASSLPPLIRHAALDQAARAHSADMAQRGQLSHVSPTSGSPADRVSAVGVAASAIAENVALHRDTASALETLLQSDAHRANLLAPDVTHVGLGAFVSDAGVYVTQVFAALAAPSAPPLPEPSRQEVAPLPAPAPAPPPPVSPPPAPRRLPGTPGATLALQPGSNGTVVVQRRPQDQAIEGYWVYGSGRWWYYPRPADVQPGQQLQPDLTIEGPPPGFPEVPEGEPQAEAVPQTAQVYVPSPVAPPPGPPGGTTVVIRPGAPFYSVPPPPLVGRPTRAWRRAHRRWQRAYRRWLRRQYHHRRVY
ncbi:MAG: CAP domain-containing protein [Sandaracinaceae bacterium]